MASGLPVLLAALSVAEQRVRLLNDLPHCGWRVLLASAADEVSALAIQHSPDLLLFDAEIVATAIPALDGLPVPRLMLGAEPERGQRMRLHDEFRICGWLPLPLDVELLVAQANALRLTTTGRTPAAGGRTIETRRSEDLGEWRLARKTWILTPPNLQPVQLTQAEATFLATLAKDPGVPVPRPVMIAGLGHNTDYFDPRRLDTLLSRLRQKIKRECSVPLPVRSIHSVGYAFAAAISLVD